MRGGRHEGRETRGEGDTRGGRHKGRETQGERHKGRDKVMGETLLEPWKWSQNSSKGNTESMHKTGHHSVSGEGMTSGFKSRARAHLFVISQHSPSGTCPSENQTILLIKTQVVPPSTTTSCSNTLAQHLIEASSPVICEITEFHRSSRCTVLELSAHRITNKHH